MHSELCHRPKIERWPLRSRFHGLACLGGLAITLLSVSLPGLAAQADSAPARILTLLEVRSDGVDRAERLLRQYAEALQAGDPAARIVLLQESDRRQRFVLLESAPGLQQLQELEMKEQPRIESLTPLLAAPRDRRAHRDFGSASAAGPAGGHAGSSGQGLYVVTHVDIAGPVSSGPQEALEHIGSAARRAAGNLDFEVWQQSNRGNHFNVIAQWAARRDFDQFASGEAARQFRASVAPLLGSPYDERLYRALCCARAAAAR